MAALALPWFVLVTTGSSARMGLVTAAELLPLAAFGIPSGALIDRLGARSTLVLSDAGRAPVTLLIPLLDRADSLSFSLLLTITFALGALSAPYFAAQRLVLPEMVGAEERVIARANSVLESVQRLTLLAGPAVAGVAIGALGAPAVLVVDAATFAFSALVVRALVPAARHFGAPTDGGGALAGLRFLVRDPLLRSLVACIVVFGFLFQSLFVALPVLAFDQYDASAGTAGLLFSAWGAGAFLGTLAAIRLSGRVDPIRLLIVAVLAGMAPFWLLAVPLPRVAVAVVLAVGAFFSPIGNAPMFTLLTTRPPASVRAKVVTAALTLNAVGGPLAGVLAGLALSRLGTYPVLLAIAAGLNATAALFARAVARGSGADRTTAAAEIRSSSC
jgi:MFS family permease